MFQIRILPACLFALVQVLGLQGKDRILVRNLSHAPVRLQVEGKGMELAAGQVGELRLALGAGAGAPAWSCRVEGLGALAGHRTPFSLEAGTGGLRVAGLAPFKPVLEPRWAMPEITGSLRRPDFIVKAFPGGQPVDLLVCARASLPVREAGLAAERAGLAKGEAMARTAMDEAVAALAAGAGWAPRAVGDLWSQAEADHRAIGDLLGRSASLAAMAAE